MENENVNSQEFLPKYETARIAVERARQIVKDNNEMILDLLKVKAEIKITDIR